ncbi:MAG: SpoIID/LytB domain-containing protein [Candidatus Omnitrophica bacterium]|nr:SpoIID/LytB domain-containing protein [Candidatus Omnitrophota bacterium]
MRFLGVLVACAWSHAPVAAEPALEPAWIRVAVVQNQPEIDLAVHGAFRITALMDNDALREGSRLQKTAIRADRQGILVGKQLLPLGGVRVEPARDATIDLNGRRLRGTLDILKQADQTLLVINHVELEDYLRGVLSREVPFYWPAEALQALAIAARTYALFQRLTNAAVDYDVTGDMLSQVYGGKSAERGSTTRAVRRTEGLVLVFDGRVFPTFYHSTCGGLTEDAAVMGPFNLAPLKGGAACSFCVASPFYRWQRTLSNEDAAWAVKQSGRGSVWPVEDLRVASYSPTGRVEKVRIRGGGRSLDLSGYEFRQLLGFERIRSTAFAVIRDGGQFILQGRGWGHGVGLCQWGTAELARRGLSAREILAYYYPGATLVRIGEIPLQAIPARETRKTKPAQPTRRP